MKRTRLPIAFFVLAITLAACSQTPEPPPPTPDVDAVVRTAVAEAVPSPTPSPTPDLDATVQAGVQATVLAQTTPTPIPTPTPVPTPVPTLTPVPRPTSLPVPSPTPNLRPKSQWTIDNPATREELEAELHKYRGHQLVFSSWGGAYQDAQRRAYAIPFSDQFGIQVIDEQQPFVEKIRARSQSSNVGWHVFDSGPASINSLGQNGHLERLNFSIIDNRSFFDVARNPYIGGGGITWSEVWAYNTDTFPEGAQPTSMADIYDPESFPGSRGWGRYPEADMVFALLSDNPDLLNTPEGRASLSALSPRQVDRAFKLFEQYRDQVDLFWQAGADCPNALSSAELDLCTGWNGRLFDSIRAGRPVKICWECGHVVQTGVWGIIKGLRQQDPRAFELAQLYMAWTALPENNARMAQFIAYGPINTLSVPYLDGPSYNHVRDNLPSSASNLPYAVFEDEVHVLSNSTEWRDRWDVFKQDLFPSQ